MAKGKQKRRSIFGSRKRKRGVSDQSLSTKKPKNETPKADEKKNVRSQTPNKEVEHIDKPAKLVNENDENSVDNQQYLSMDETLSVTSETTDDKLRDDEKKSVEAQTSSNKVDYLATSGKSIDKAESRVQKLSVKPKNETTSVKEIAAKKMQASKKKTVKAQTLKDKVEFPGASAKSVDKAENSAMELSKKLANETMSKDERAAKGLHTKKEKAVEAQSLKNQVEYLDTPVKSPYDEKEYRFIKLPNGLKALLIAVPIGSRTDGESESDSFDSDMSISRAVFKPRDSRFEEGIRASCAVCIDVGKFSDPPGIPRLGEYLEHLVANGSKKFPKEKHWIFAAGCGGRFNNFTQSDQTLFTITAVEEHCLEEALDWIAQLFISPVMNRNDVPDIRQTVEQGNSGEYEYLRDLESNTREELFRTLARPGHPATKLGQAKLPARQKLTNDKLYKELLKFKERHYSAHRMTAVIEAKFSLDVLEKHAIKYFSAIPSNGLPPDDFSQFKGVDPFDRAENPKIHRMTAYRNNFNVQMRWIMPPLHEHYRTKPHHYIARILGHEGRGSLFSYLEQKEWCLDLSAGIGRDSFENNSLYTTFILSLTVTDEGNRNMWQVIDAVYAYINVMRTEGPQESIYNEIQKVEENNFRLRPKILNEDVVEICTVARLYPPADCITGRVLYFEYNPDAIKSCMDLLTPERAKIIYLEYGENPFDSSKPEVVKTNDALLVNRWNNVASIPGLHLPEKNGFITEDQPVKIHEDEFSEVWFKRYRKYVNDETYMTLHYMSPLPFVSTNNFNGLNLLVAILKDLLCKDFYSIDVHRAPNGVWVEAENYSRNLSSLMKKATIFITNCWHLLTEDIFNEQKKTLQKSYSVHLKNSSRLAENLESTLLCQSFETLVDLHESLRDLEFDEFHEFVKSFTDRMRIQCFVQGNMMTVDIIETTRKCVEILNCRPLSPNALRPIGVNKIPRGERCLRVKSLDRTCLHSVVRNVYQFGAPSAKMTAVIDGFCEYASYFPVEDYCVDECKAGALGYTITSRTSKSKTVEEIDDYIEEFRSLVYGMIKSMDEEELLDAKDSMKEAKMKEWTARSEDLKKKATANWDTIMNHKYDFDAAQRHMEIIESMTIEEIRAMILELTSKVTSRRSSKLSIQIVGYNDPKEKSTVVGAEKRQESSEYTLKHLSRLSRDKKKPGSNYYITDYKQFKDSLKF